MRSPEILNTLSAKACDNGIESKSSAKGLSTGNTSSSQVCVISCLYLISSCLIHVLWPVDCFGLDFDRNWNLGFFADDEGVGGVTLGVYS